MKNHTRFRNHATCLAAILVAAGAGMTLQAATAPPALNGQVVIRPLVPQEKTDYQLPSTLQLASGLNNVGLGQPAYLDALVSIQLPAADVTNVTWSLVGAPGSSAVLEDSPLGANVPPYKMIDRLDAQVISRKMLRPDVTGKYQVTVLIETATSGSSTKTVDVVGATYMGLYTCSLCHSGSESVPDMVTPWRETGHAELFTLGIDGIASDHYSANCISCHTVGYDKAAGAVNGGFDDMATQLGWTFPPVTTNGNWAALDPKLKNLGNIQCENCHGPGSEHAKNLGVDLSLITASFAAGDCAQCHDSGSHHKRSSEWNNSRHAIAVEETGSSCARCHHAEGFANYASGKPAVTVEYEVITCAGCHSGHDATLSHQLRKLGPVTLMDTTTTITEGGNGLLCMNCHMSRRNGKTYAETTAGSNRFGPHHGPQADMLAGANAYNYDKAIPSSAHREVVEESCVQCHMQEFEVTTSPAFKKVGGHTFSLTWEGDGTNGPVHMVEACVECHGEIENFDFPRQDYDGDGVVEGVQTEVHGLLGKLGLLLPPLGVAKDTSSPSGIAITSSWTRPQLKAAYNWLFVVEDGSYGVHNLSYAVGLLKESIASLTGDANSDGIADEWQIQYFGSASNPNAAPYASPAGDGIPNWIKFTLGLDPMVPGVVTPSGVVWANGKGLVNPPGTPGDNMIAIYTAAEVVFKTEKDKKYVVEAASAVSDGWLPVSPELTGTGETMSYVAPTRENVQQFYRVVAK